MAKKKTATKAKSKAKAKAPPEPPPVVVEAAPEPDAAGSILMTGGATWNWSMTSSDEGAVFHAYSKRGPGLGRFAVDFNRAVELKSCALDGSEIGPKHEGSVVCAAVTGSTFDLEVEWVDQPPPVVSEWF